jgi:hypothetical protein
MNIDISNNKTVKLLINVCLSSAGVYALLFSFGFLSLRAKLNMLGVWTNISLSQEIYVNETIVSIPRLLAGLLISSFLLLPISYVIFILLRKLFSLKTKKIMPMWYFIIFIASFFLLYYFLQPLGNQDLLLKNGQSNEFASLIINRQLFTHFFYQFQIVTSIFLLYVLLRLWTSRDLSDKNIYFIFKIMLTMIFSMTIFLIPINHGVLISSNEYRRATLRLKSNDSIPDFKESFQVYPIIETSNELVFAFDAGDISNSDTEKIKDMRVVMIKSYLIKSITFADKSDDIMRLAYKDNKQIGGNDMGFTKLFITLLMFLLTTAFLGIIPERVNAQSTKSEEKEGQNDTSWARVFPALKNKSLDGLFQILENLSSGLKGDKPSVNDMSQLNIWIYDIKKNNYKQITKDGGYLYPRISLDGKKISYIKNSQLGIMDFDGSDKKVVDSQKKYQKLLGWNSKTSEYLLSTEEGTLYFLNVEKKSLKEINLGTGDFKNVDVESFIRLSQTSSNQKEVYDARKNNVWAIYEYHEDYEEPKELIKDGYINYSPSWIDEDKIIFVSNRSSINHD